jgi:hypothetical protein
MASLAFNTLLDRWKQAYLTFAGDTGFRDQLLRAAMNYQDFKLTAAQMDTGNATPVQILAAPPAGFMNVIFGIMTKIAPGATPFELGSGTLGYLLTDGSGAAVATAVPNASVESATTAYYWSVPLAVAALAATKIVAKPSADVTAGDGAVYGRIYYRTIKIAELV